MISLKKIQNEFSLNGFINSGAYGSVFEFQDKKGRVYAVKFIENASKKITNHYFFFKGRPLCKEGMILSKLQNIPGIPKLYYYGKSPIAPTNSFMIVTELLGNNLNSEFLNNRVLFTFDFIVKMALKILQILKLMHKKNIVHRDIKPANILLAKDKTEDFYLVDFGLAKTFKTKDNRFFNKFIGSSLFAANACHYFQNPEKKHDLESLGYVLLYFIQGSLPWQNIKENDFEEKIIKIGQMKQKFLDKELKNLPLSLKSFFEYLIAFKSNDKLDYNYLTELLIKLGKELNDSKKEKSSSICLCGKKILETASFNSTNQKNLFEKNGNFFNYPYNF